MRRTLTMAAVASAAALAVAFGGAPSAAAPASDPSGAHWHCQQYTTAHRTLDSYDCISGAGFLYGGAWAYVADYYQHPNPGTDYTLNEAYFRASAPNGYTHVPNYYRRLIVVDDGKLGVPVEPVNWDINPETPANPPPPRTCMILQGPQAGKRFPCPPDVQKSIVDYWNQGQVIPGWTW